MEVELRTSRLQGSILAISWIYRAKQFCIGALPIHPQDMCENLLGEEDEDRVLNVLKYVEDADLRRWQLPNTKKFHTALRDERAKLNCVTNPHVFEQLDVSNLLARGKSFAHDRLESARKLIHNPFKIRLGRGSYGECLAIRTDGNSKLSHEIGLELSQRSAAAGFRPIGAVVFMQRCILKICLRTTDSRTNTAVIVKAYGGGGKPSSSSFARKMDEFNAWTSVNSYGWQPVGLSYIQVPRYMRSAGHKFAEWRGRDEDQLMLEPSKMRGEKKSQS